MLDTSGCEKPAGRRAGGLAGLRVSKFRHVYGVPAKKERCYDNLRLTRSPLNDGHYAAVNPAFLAVVVEVENFLCMDRKYFHDGSSGRRRREFRGGAAGQDGEGGARGVEGDGSPGPGARWAWH